MKNKIYSKSKLYLFHPKFKDYSLHRLPDLINTSKLTPQNNAYKYYEYLNEFINGNNQDLESLELFISIKKDNEIFSSPLVEELFNHYEKADKEQFDNNFVNQIINNLESMIFNVNYEYNKDNPEKLIEYIEYFNSTKYISSNDSIINTSLNFDNTDDVHSLEQSMESKYKAIMPSIHKAFSSDGYLPNSLIVVAAPTGKGKSLFMLQTAGDFVKQGSKVLYISVGADLTKSHILTRLLMQFSEKTFTQLKEIGLDKSLKEFQDNIFPELFVKDNFGLMILPPDEITASHLINRLIKLNYHRKFDSFFIDYDGHFAKGNSLDMYNSGGNIYAQLTKITAINSNIVFVGCQVNKGNYDKEFIGLDALAESSKKQHIAACVIMISDNKLLKNEDLQMGTINIPKARHGKTCSFYYLRDQYLNFNEISKSKYESFTQASHQHLAELVKSGNVLNDDLEEVI